MPGRMAKEEKSWNPESERPRQRKLFTPPVLDADEWAMIAEEVEQKAPLLAARIYDSVGLFSLAAAARDKA